MEAQQQSARSLITDSGIIVAVISAFFYLFTLASQVGYYSYFNIPYEFIPMNIAMIWRMSWLLATIVFIISALITFAIYLAVGFTSIHKPFIAPPKREDSKSVKELIALLRNGYFIFSLIYLAIILLSNGARYVGVYEAKNREEFFIVNNVPKLPETLVVFQIQGDYIVTVPLDRSNLTVEKKIYLLKASELGETAITHEKIGRLTVKP